MKLKRDTKFGEELTCHFKIDIKNLTNFDLSTQKSQKFSLWWAPFEQSIYCLSWKTTEKLSFMKLKRNTKLGEESACQFKTDIRNLANFDLTTRRSQKKITLIGSFWAKYILFELKKYRGVISHETEEGYKIWRGIDLSFQNWHKEFDKFWPGYSKVSKIFTLMGSFWAKYILFELKST